METASGITDKLRAWILARRDDLVDVPLDVDLIENRLISSLDFVAFLLYVEELRGAPIPADEVDMETFRTLETIQQRLFA